MRLAPGEVTVVAAVRSPVEECTRTLRLYVPAGAHADDAVGVLVALDGQNLFARSRAGAFGTWAVDDTLDGLVGAGAIDPWIVVGVDHRGVDRIADDSPWPDPRMTVEPRGHRFAEFLADDLIAWMDGALPARATRRRALCGSSLGGLAALYTGWLHPRTYPAIAAFSPSVMWSSGELARSWVHKADVPQRLYLDAGVDERFDGGGFVLDYGAATRDFADHLRRLGHGEDELRLVLDPEGRHDEASWGRRFEGALRWLVGRQAPVIR